MQYCSQQKLAFKNFDYWERRNDAVMSLESIHLSSWAQWWKLLAVKHDEIANHAVSALRKAIGGKKKSRWWITSIETQLSAVLPLLCSFAVYPLISYKFFCFFFFDHFFNSVFMENKKKKMVPKSALDTYCKSVKIMWP